MWIKSPRHHYDHFGYFDDVGYCEELYVDDGLGYMVNRPPHTNLPANRRHSLGSVNEMWDVEEWSCGVRDDWIGSN